MRFAPREIGPHHTGTASASHDRAESMVSSAQGSGQLNHGHPKVDRIPHACASGRRSRIDAAQWPRGGAERREPDVPAVRAQAADGRPSVIRRSALPREMRRGSGLETAARTGSDSMEDSGCTGGIG